MKNLTHGTPAKIVFERKLVVVGTAVTCLIVSAAYFVWPRAKTLDGHHHVEATGHMPGEGDVEPTEVQLPQEKLERASITFTKAERRPFTETRAVPGQITYDGAKHLAITAPVDGVVKRVLAEPGQAVKQGTPLVVMSSPEVGLARDEVLRRIVELELVELEHRWAMDVAANVAQLLKWFPERPKLTDIEAKLNDRPLGEYRERLVSAYSKLLLAEQIVNSTGDADQQGAIARRVIEERRSNREVAAATFLSACETSRFEANQAHRRSHAALTQARRLVDVAKERLVTLLGPQVESLDVHIDDEPPPATPGAATHAASPAEPSTREDAPKPATPPAARVAAELSEFTLLAPFSGRIDERMAVTSARVKQGDPLFIIADTSTVWVEAEIHERNWVALQHVEGAKIPVRVPALNDAAFPTSLRFVGSKVSPVSRSVPLVTTLSNAEGLFKPGMFVWVDVPLEQERKALVVPAGAIMRHEGQAFVFVAVGERTYKRVNVDTGLESGSLIEILRGLEEGQQVVESGAFYLKSELLLEREVE